MVLMTPTSTGNHTSETARLLPEAYETWVKFGATLGVGGKERTMWGLATYGYAQTLLRLERAEEFLLYLYAYRYHLHQRGHWTARESAGISRLSYTEVDPYCTPSQQTVPLLIRWMLVL